MSAKCRGRSGRNSSTRRVRPISAPCRHTRRCTERRPARLGQTGDARLILLGALVLADELAEANDALQRAGSPAPAAEAPDGAAQSIRDIAQRIESIAARHKTP